jgi:hypothetical protein
MRSLEINGISEAKKAPVKVAFGPEAFSASESTLFPRRFDFFASGAAAPKRFLLALHRCREIQLLTRADGFAAAQFES